MKKFLIPIFVFLVLVFCYVYFENSKGAGTAALVPNGPSSNQAGIGVGAEIILLLQKLDRVKLDTSLFREQGFQSLRDFSITLRPQSVGRPNPFAPIGSDATGASASRSSSQSPAPATVAPTPIEEPAESGATFEDDEALFLLEEQQ